MKVFRVQEKPSFACREDGVRRMSEKDEPCEQGISNENRIYT